MCKASDAATPLVFAKHAMDLLSQFETPAYLVGRDGKGVKHQAVFAVETALRV